MPDTNPACRTAFRSTSEIVRHQIGTLSGITPECCPPSVRNPVRRGPDYARVEAEILRYIDIPVWEHAKFVESVEVKSMQDFHKSWQASISLPARND